MKKNYFYNLYGLNIKSELEIKELESLKNANLNNYDVEIKLGKLPSEKIKYISNDRLFFAEKDSFTFSIEKVASYHVSNGNSIIVEPYSKGYNQLLEALLIGASFGMLLYQRGIVVIHGGTVIVNNRAIVITGQSGAGKSTLVNGFRHRGFRFMADDVSVTGLDENNNIVVKPAYPQQKICKDIMIKMGYNLDDFKLIDEGREKYIIPVCESFRKEELDLGAIFYITKGSNNKVKVEEIKGSEKLNIFMENIYEIRPIRECGMDKEYFVKCLNVAKRIPIFKITRPANGFTIDEQMEKIEKIMGMY